MHRICPPLSFGVTLLCILPPAKSLAADPASARREPHPWARRSNPRRDQADGCCKTRTRPRPQSAAEAEPSPTSPFSFAADYYLYSDYVFRGVNLSEYEGEGREKPHHQLSACRRHRPLAPASRRRGALGTLSLGTCFYWFAAQHELDPENGGQNLQEIDYDLSWAYELETLSSTLTLGYAFYTIPNGKAYNTGEWSIRVDHVDAWMWHWLWPDNEEGVLNPFVAYSHDVQAAAGGSWIDAGVSHDFAVLENLTLTPSITVGVDHRYLDRVLGTGRAGATRLATIEYGLNLAYDLSGALELPDDVGSFVLTWFLYFSDAVGNAEDNRTIQDEFYGGNVRRVVVLSPPAPNPPPLLIRAATVRERSRLKPRRGNEGAVFSLPKTRQARSEGSRRRSRAWLANAAEVFDLQRRCDSSPWRQRATYPACHSADLGR